MLPLLPLDVFTKFIFKNYLYILNKSHLQIYVLQISSPLYCLSFALLMVSFHVLKLTMTNLSAFPFRVGTF